MPDRFVTGEETALLRAVAGRPAKPTLKPPFPFERGLDNRPTLVQNAETLAHLALIARYGAALVSRGRDAATRPAPRSSRSRARSPGRACTRSSSARRVGELLARGGGATEPFSAVLVGGYFGGWVGAAEASSHRLAAGDPRRGRGRRLSRHGLRRRRVRARAALPRRRERRPVRPVRPRPRRDRRRLRAARARQAGRRPGTLRRWAGLVTGRGACRHPDGAARFLASSLTVFADELARHARNGSCGRAAPPDPAARTARDERTADRTHPRRSDRLRRARALRRALSRADPPGRLGLPDHRPDADRGALVGHARRAVAQCPKLALRLRTGRARGVKAVGRATLAGVRWTVAVGVAVTTLVLTGGAPATALLPAQRVALKAVALARAANHLDSASGGGRPARDHALGEADSQPARRACSPARAMPRRRSRRCRAS